MAVITNPLLLDVDLKVVGGALGVIVLLLFLIHCINAVFFHPLSKFRGPVAAAITPLWIVRHWNSGNYVFAIKQLHDKYGPIVRVSTNQLSFCSATSWQDIYGRVPGRKPFLKTKFFYEAMPGESENVLTETDPSAHSQMRRNLSHGFSASALSSQEGVVQGFVDKFIDRIGEDPENPKEMVMWLNLITFDIIGKLAFGESFGNLNAGKPHFWLDILFDSIQALTFLRSFEYFASTRAMFRWIVKKDLLPKSVTAELKKVKQYTHDQVKKRLQASPGQTDFLERMLADRKEEGTLFSELEAQAEVLILAGSETTATALSGILYYLGRNAHVYKKLAQEIRTNFQSYENITGRSTDTLPYLKAVIEEGLRIYPPVPIGLPRVSPGEVVDGHYIPQGTIVHVSSWSATHSEENFHRPLDFIPERWLDPECKDQKSASQPFILGSRVCLGRHMAQMEMRLILSKLFWRYDFALADDTTDWLAKHKTYVFWKKPDLRVNFTRREGNSAILESSKTD